MTNDGDKKEKEPESSRSSRNKQSTSGGNSGSLPPISTSRTRGHSSSESRFRNRTTTVFPGLGNTPEKPSTSSTDGWELNSNNPSTSSSSRPLTFGTSPETPRASEASTSLGPDAKKHCPMGVTAHHDTPRPEDEEDYSTPMNSPPVTARFVEDRSVGALSLEDAERSQGSSSPDTGRTVIHISAHGSSDMTPAAVPAPGQDEHDSSSDDAQQMVSTAPREPGRAEDPEEGQQDGQQIVPADQSDEQVVPVVLPDNVPGPINRQGPPPSERDGDVEAGIQLNRPQQRPPCCPL